MTLDCGVTSMSDMSEEELISAYVDGQLGEPERIAFESRLKSNALLRRRVEVTRLLVREAHAVPSVAVPRNFILPRDVAQQREPDRDHERERERERSRLPIPTLIFRFGSVVAALLFTFLIGWDVLQTQTMSPQTMSRASAPAPMAAPADTSPTVAEPASDVNAATTMAASVATTVNATAIEPLLNGGVRAGATLPIATTEMALPPSQTEAAQQKAPALSALSEGNGQAESMQTQSLPVDMTVTPQPKTALPTQPPTVQTLPAVASETQLTVVLTVAPAIVASPQPAPMPIRTPSSNSLITLPRVLAALALLVAVVLGVLGWVRRS